MVPGKVHAFSENAMSMSTHDEWQVVLREREQEIQEHLLNARQDSKDSVVSPTISIRSANGRHSLDRTAGSEPDLQELQVGGRLLQRWCCANHETYSKLVFTPALFDC